MIVDFLKTLFLLLCGHALADYALQSSSMIFRKDPTRINSEEHKHGPWWWTMTAHCLINGFFVLFFIGHITCAIAETIIHFAADTAKCRGRISTNTDQIIHLTCKVIWAAYATGIHKGYL